ncbi:MAG: single-stranded DNA-binding protein [Spirochaetales bacterium]|jgi:hypothetical protein|nr:single-stranded DNA-binding protein [Spirochaetales bacterium]
MSDLNSILFEGAVAGEPVIAGQGKEKHCSFILANRRYRREGGESKIRTTRMRIVAHDAKMAELIVRCAYAGRMARVVGCTAEDEAGIYIAAEHIEYKPELNGGKKE